VGTTPQHLPEIAAAAQRMGVPRKHVHTALYKHPAILDRSPEDVLNTRRRAPVGAALRFLGVPFCCATILACCCRHGRLVDCTHIREESLPTLVHDLQRVKSTFPFRSVLTDILGSPVKAVRLIPRHPELLAVDLTAAHAALLAALRPHNIIADAAAAILSAAPELLAADCAAMQPVLDLLAGHGIQVGNELTIA